MGKEFSQAFTTGGYTRGYTLTSVVLNLGQSAANTNAVLAVKITEASSNAPGTVVGTLTNPATIVRGENEFTDTGLSLAANTEYFVFIDNQTDCAGNVRTTSADTETGLSDWSIANVGRTRASTSTGSTGWGDIGSSLAIKMEIRGHMNLGDLSGLTVSPVDNSSTKLQVSWNSFTDADKYLVKWKTGGGSFNTGEESTTTSHTITDLTAGTEYAVEVTAIDTDAAAPNQILAKDQANGTTNMPTVTIAGGNAVTEGTAAEFTVTASYAPESDLTIKLVVRDATGSDFLAAADQGNKTVTIATGSTSVVHSVPTVADGDEEADGEVSVSLLPGTGYKVSRTNTQGTVTVRDDDGIASCDSGGESETVSPPELTMTHEPSELTEGDTLTLTVTASCAPVADLDVSVGIMDAKKTGASRFLDSDYVSVRTATINSGAASTTLEIETVDDEEPEEDGTLFVAILGGGGVSGRPVIYTLGSPRVANVLVKDNDGPPLPRVTIAGRGAVTEGSAAVFTLSVSPAHSAALTVNVLVSELSGSDFLAPGNEGSTAVSIPAGSARATLRVPTVDDRTPEDDGGVTATLSPGSGYRLGSADSATVTVADNDSPGVTISRSELIFDEGGSGSYTVVLNTLPTGNVTVTPSISPLGVATLSPPRPLTFTPANWNSPQTVTVTGRPDDEIDSPGDDPTATISHAVSGYGSVTNAWDVEVTVRDDDVAKVNISKTILTIPAGGTRSYDVWLNSQPTHPTEDVKVTPLAPPGNLVELKLPGDKDHLVFTRGADGNWRTRQTVYVSLPSDVPRGLTVEIRHIVEHYNPDTAESVMVKAVTADISSDLPGRWLLAFGRSVADQAVSAAENRFALPRRSGFSGQAAGHALAAPSPEVARALAQPEWFENERHSRPGHSLTAREAFGRTSFSLTTTSQEGGFSSVWARGAVAQFDGRAGSLSFDGSVASALIGADWSGPGWTAGLMVSRSRGDGNWNLDGDGGTVRSTLTALHPYGRLEANGTVSLWGVAGLGSGRLSLTPKDGDTVSAGTEYRMAALGIRSRLPNLSGLGGADFSVKADARVVRMSSDAAGVALVATSSGDSRLRVGLEAAWPGMDADGGLLTPSLELGLRRDSGDLVNGYGADIGGRVVWSSPQRGLSITLSARGLVTHEAPGDALSRDDQRDVEHLGAEERAVAVGEADLVEVLVEELAVVGERDHDAVRAEAVAPAAQDGPERSVGCLHAPAVHVGHLAALGSGRKVLGIEPAVPRLVDREGIFLLRIAPVGRVGVEDVHPEEHRTIVGVCLEPTERGFDRVGPLPEPGAGHVDMVEARQIERR